MSAAAVLPIAIPLPSPADVAAALKDLFKDMLRLSGLGDPLAAVLGRDCIAEVARVPRSVGIAQPGWRRAWRAVPQTAETEPVVQALGNLVGLEADQGFNVFAQHEASGTVVGEQTLVMTLVGPVLRRMGWQAADYSPRLDDGSRPDGLLRPVAFEFKRPAPAYDCISAANSHRAYATVADQILHYLRHEGVECVIYSNGRFWWRLEEDAITGRLYVLRFNLHDVVMKHRRNVWHRSLVGWPPPARNAGMENFIRAFHASAFAPDNSATIEAHPGLPQMFPGVGPVWVKDLKADFGSV
ncbi:hypothetical protein D3869_16935 (plasmid) [Azospirillum brasilense]|uniref:Uncharacterized protein n=1 Tax=Azospirillum brasilense TaxID=192 RepID=A0A4D8R2V9_AZOBR|nr:hypothetical protein [Azospirillum brasilense]QCO16977.1 hypothetical protein D3869_16935 [Azospirillum brasilense]